MSFQFGDGFDCYAAPADMVAGYWDSGTASASAFTLVAGRFAGSQALRQSASSSPYLVKSSATNDAVHHLIVAFQQITAITGTTLHLSMQLLDGTTGQVCVVFRSDGAILLTSATAAGTILATYTGAFSVTSTWYAFEFEIIIHPTAGRFRVRKNGNPVDDFDSGAVLNTRPGANTYANKLQINANTAAAAQLLDDLYWRSDASSVPWMGDIRCYTRAPASDASVQFSRAPTNFFAQYGTGATAGSSMSANNIRAVAVAAPTTGTLASLSFGLNAGVTGHVKMALYDATGSGGGPGTLLASSVELTNPGAGVNTFSVTAGPTLVRGTTYWVALWSDIAVTGATAAPTTTAVDTLALTYTTSFPSTMVGFTGPSTLQTLGSAGMNVTPLNAGCVNEPQQDATTSYVYDSVPGHADLYGIAAIASTPLSTYAVTTRAYAIKSDAGTRTMAVQLKSGSTTVASPTVVLTPSNWQWAWRHDTLDPATGAAWTAAAVNVAQVGPVVIA
jgi:hypothetical protein